MNQNDGSAGRALDASLRQELATRQDQGAPIQAWHLDKLPPITEQEANDIARTACLEYPTDYNQGEHFQPHAWVTASIMRASARQPDPNYGQWDTLEGRSELKCEPHLYRVHPDHALAPSTVPPLADVMAMIDRRADRLAADAAHRVISRALAAAEFEGLEILPDGANAALDAIRTAIHLPLKDQYARRMVVALASGAMAVK